MARQHTPAPPLTIETILEWADAHREATGAWPLPDSGQVHDQPGETLLETSTALYEGTPAACPAARRSRGCCGSTGA
jgi:hypothetical protein